MTDPDRCRIIQLSQGKFAIVDEEDYEELSKIDWNATQFGHIWYATKNIKREDGKWRTTLIHRLIMQAKQNQQIDHINGDGLDNRKENLRFCTQAQNQMNRHKITGKSRFKGVAYHKQGNLHWQARIWLNNCQKSLKYFRTEEGAALAYNKAAKEAFGEYAKLNEI